MLVDLLLKLSLKIQNLNLNLIWNIDKNRNNIKKIIIFYTLTIYTLTDLDIYYIYKIW